MKKSTLEIPMKPQEPQSGDCAHHWVKINTPRGKALKCEFCGKVIDSQD